MAPRKKNEGADSPEAPEAKTGLSDLDREKIKNATLAGQLDALKDRLAKLEAQEDFVDSEHDVDEPGETIPGQSVNRTPRAKESLDMLSKEETFVPQSLLPDPPYHPDWVYRWIRVSSYNDPDTRNASVRFREGWTPVPSEEMEEEVKAVSDVDDRFAAEGNIVIGGLMLCRMPRKKAEAMQRHYADLANRQIEGVDANLMREVDPRSPVLAPERSTRTTFGSR